MSSRLETDRRPTPRRRVSAHYPSVQSFAQDRGYSARSILRALAVEMEDRGGGSSADLSDIGVVVKRVGLSSRASYHVVDADCLALWYASGESLTLAPSDADNLAAVLDQLVVAIRLRRDGRAHSAERKLLEAAAHFSAVARRLDH